MLRTLAQAWFWTTEWQEAEKQAQADIKAGRARQGRRRHKQNKKA